MLRTLPLLVAVVFATGSSTYSTRRAALVPEVAPPMRSGAAMENIGELSLNAPGIVTLGDARASAGEEPGVELPGFTLGGAGRLRVTKGFDIGLVWEDGRDQGSHPIAADQPAVDNGDTYGWGLSFNYSREIGDDGLSIAFAGDFLSYSVPWVEYKTCVTGCAEGGPPLTTVERGRTSVPVMSLGVIPSWKTGRWRLFGGVSARNQPTVERGGIEGDLEFNDDVTKGQLNWMLSAGAELDFGGGLRALALVYQPVGGTPIDYPPTFAVGMSFGFGKPKAKTGYLPPPPAAEPTASGARSAER